MEDSKSARIDDKPVERDPRVYFAAERTILAFRFREEFDRGDPFVTPRGLMMIVLSVLLAVVGIAMTMYLIILGA